MTVDVPHLTGGVAFGIPNDKSAVAAAVGIADPLTNRSMTTDATFRIASQTKTFTAAAVLRLHEEGELDIDDSIERFFDGGLVRRLSVIDGIPRGHEISVRQLLAHSSGLAECDAEPFFEILFSRPEKRWTPWEKVEMCISARPPYFPPGQGVRYCDPGYILLAMIIEQVTEAHLASPFRSLLSFEDLGLRTIHLESLEPTPQGAGPRVRHFVGERDVTDIDPSCDLWGAGWLVSDAHDVAWFWRHLFDSRVFASPKTFEIMRHHQLSEGHGPLAMGLMYAEWEGLRIWRHGGAWGSIVLHEETTRTTVAAFVNQYLDGIPFRTRYSFYLGLLRATA